jgi:DNA-binding transcriptional LysR family regulator
VTEFLLQHPEVRIELQLSDQITDLAGSAVDVAIRMTNTPAPGLIARHLADLSYVICAAPDYLARHGQPTTAAELRQHNCVFYESALIQNDWHLTTPQGQEMSVAVSGSLTTNSIEVLRTAAVGGLGIVALSRYVLEAELQRGELVELLADHQMPTRQVHLVTLPDRLLPAKTRAFIDFLLSKRMGR